MAASKLKQILQLEPASEITFRGPFEHVVTSYLELKNPSDKRICFKVKTTAPKRYCVRPNSGIVQPDGKMKIAIMLQPLDPDSEAEARTKHKFMVQSTIINSDDEDIPLDEVWQNTNSELIMDSKLRCVFLTPEQQDGDGDGEVSVGTKQQQPKVTEARAGYEPSKGGALLPERASGTTTATTATTTTQQPQQARKQQPELISTSTPIAPRNTPSSTTKQWGTGTSVASQSLKQGAADMSIASSHNLTSTFMQSMSDDYKIVLVSLVMLVLGVILGKYII